MTKPDETDPVPPATPATNAKRAQREAEPEDGKSTYSVTELAGPKVAGRRVADLTPKRKVRLSEEEARAELLAGTIVKDGDTLDEMFTRSGPKAA